MLSPEIACYVTAYREWLVKRKTAATVKGYTGVLRRALSILEAAQLQTDPSQIGEQEIWHLLHMWNSLKPSGRIRQIKIFGIWLKRVGKNYVTENMDLPEMQDVRTPGAGWLDLHIAVNVLSFCETIEERFAIICMLYHGFRKIEVERSLHSDWDPTARKVRIWGKGPLGGKVRHVPIHPLAKGVLEECMQDRQRKIEAAAAHYTKSARQLQIPDQQFLYFNVQLGLGHYRHTAIEKMIKAVSDRMGVYFSCHTLRKTFARMSWLADVKMETISEFLGHSDARTTRLYLGLNMDDMEKGMDQLKTFMERVRSSD